MTRRDLARATSITVRTIADFERGDRDTHASTIQALCTALKGAGIIFIEGDDTIGTGVRLRAPQKT